MSHLLRVASFNVLSCQKLGRLQFVSSSLGRHADVFGLQGTQLDDVDSLRETSFGKFTRIHWGRRGRVPGRDRVGGVELFLRSDLFPICSSSAICDDTWHHRYDVGRKSELWGRLGGVRFRNRLRNYDYAFFVGYAFSEPKNLVTNAVICCFGAL